MFRDDLRADASPVHQLDIEMALDEEGIMKLAEDLIKAAFKSGVASSFPKSVRRRWKNTEAQTRFTLRTGDGHLDAEGVN